MSDTETRVAREEHPGAARLRPGAAFDGIAADLAVAAEALGR